MINKSVNLESKSISCKRIVWLSPVSHLRYDIQACVMINWTAENGEIIDGSCHVAAIKWIVYTSVWRSSLATICDMWFTATHFSRKMGSNWFNFSVAPVCCYDNAHIILQYRWHSFRASMFQYFNALKPPELMLGTCDTLGMWSNEFPFGLDAHSASVQYTS